MATQAHLTVPAVSPRRRRRGPLARATTWLTDAPPRLVALVVFGALFVLYAATATYSSQQEFDTLATLAPAWHFATHGNFSLDDIVRKASTLFFVHDNGRIVSDRMPGAIFFAIPFYWVAGGSPAPTFFPAAFAAAVAAAAAMSVLFLLFRRLTNQRVALVGTALAALGTSTWSISADAIWPHGPDQLWIALGLLLVASQRRWLSGPAFGAALLTRPHTALIAASVGLGEAWRRRSIRPLIEIGFGTALGPAALVLYNRQIHGGSSVQGAYPAQANTDVAGWHHLLTNVAGTLVSPERGILVLAPFLLLLVPGLRRAWAVAPSWARSAAVGGLLYMGAQLWHNGFTGGEDFYSYRLPLEMLTAAAPLLLLCYTEWTSHGVWRRRLFAATAALSVTFQVYGGAFFPNRYGFHDAWTTFMPGWSRRSPAFLALVGIAMLVAAVVWWWRRRPSVERELAVTP